MWNHDLHDVSVDRALHGSFPHDQHEDLGVVFALAILFEAAGICAQGDIRRGAPWRCAATSPELGFPTAKVPRDPLALVGEDTSGDACVELEIVDPETGTTRVSQ